MDEPMRPDAPALSFGQAAKRYDLARPSYPEAALEWALGNVSGAAEAGERLRVVDLGAGTGILSRVLLALGHDVIAIEPDPGMRARLAATTPAAVARAGSAERIPLPAASADAVVAGQAYHWFAPERAHPEIARVLRPGGVFAAIWNLRDESEPWVARLTEILGDRRAASDVRTMEPDFGPRFGPLTRRTFRHEVEMTPTRLVDLIRTRSYYLAATPVRRRELEEGVRDLAARLPWPVSMPYETLVFVAVRADDAP
jgi:SAM-dependent methyltransferase